MIVSQVKLGFDGRVLMRPFQCRGASGHSRSIHARARMKGALQGVRSSVTAASAVDWRKLHDPDSFFNSLLEYLVPRGEMLQAGVMRSGARGLLGVWDLRR